jgi:hypothetical protein
MHRIILLIIISATIFFTTCQKKSDDPAPISNKTTTSNNIPDTTSNKPSFGHSSAIASNADTTLLTTSEIFTYSTYSIDGKASTTSDEYMSAIFNNGKPTKNSTEDLSTSTTLQLVYTTTNTYRATQGTATVIITDSSITVTFKNVTFTDSKNNTTIQYSGQLTIATNSLPAVTSGSITVDDIIYPLSVSSTYEYGYDLIGYTDSRNFLDISLDGKPTASSTIDLSNSSAIMLKYFTTDGDYYMNSASGNVYVTVNGTAVTVSFTNVVFDDGNGHTPTISGTLYTSK